ncbi:MAG: UDP-N-acetylmuramoyl-tripeptide--D-alanyl-D-alanine ligase [Clostridia bacterium]|nr:UDP-N-acetylmuramoyl-tripeptide--D-alanyl-D-alanine ligase [Clostridia bacterium]
MIEHVLRGIAAVVTAFLFCASTQKAAGALQQSGYKNGAFLRWLGKKGNLYFNRLAVFALCLALTSGIFSLSFSFLGEKIALTCAALPFLGLSLLFYWADYRFALKVPFKRTGRFNRLFVGYVILTAAAGFGLLSLLGWLKEINGSQIYALVAYIPYAVMPVALPLLLCLTNLILGVFEGARNKKFVKRAGQVLDESQTVRIGIVGSYGKTSVKNILATLLQEKFSAVATPESYNTPMGIAKTVLSGEFAGKQIFIAEMGARKTGDIAELCDLVKPDYAIFTGVCAQHMQTFGSVQNAWTEKSEILKCGAKRVVCGEGLRERIESEFSGADCVAYAERVSNLSLQATCTEFTLCVDGKEISVSTKLLGGAAVENIALAARLCRELGMTAEEIGAGIAKLQPVPHRLQLIESGGAYILDDGYNCNVVGAKEALSALSRFAGRKCVVTPGIVECGVLEEKINGELGEEIAKIAPDKVILVGETLVGAVKDGYKNAGGDEKKLSVVKDLKGAQTALGEWVGAGDAVLFLNDLPDVY